MKKSILFAIGFALYALVAGGLLSCTKEQPVVTQQTTPKDELQELMEPIPGGEPAPPAKPTYTIPDTVITTEAYSTIVSNDCYPEMVHLSGTKVTKLFEFKTNKTYYIYYEISLQGMAGFGEKSGLLYQGGGKSVDISSVSLYSLASYGKQTYNVKYISNDSTHYILYNDKAEHYQNSRGKVITDYNHINDTCK
jgi:hypothetical protein